MKKQIVLRFSFFLFLSFLCLFESNGTIRSAVPMGLTLATDTIQIERYSPALDDVSLHQHDADVDRTVFNGSTSAMDCFKSIVRELSSASYQGRGYAYNGVRKAARYIERQFRDGGVDDVTLQPFTLDINTFPKKMKMAVDGRELNAGTDFTLREYSPGVKGCFGLYYIDTLNYNPDRIFEDLAKPENKNVFVVCDFWFTYRHKADFQKMESTELPNRGMIYTWDTPLKFYKAYGEKVADKPIIWVMRDVLEGNPSHESAAKYVRLNIYNRFLDDYATENVIGKVEGESHDSCFVFVAHYDHLGNLGKKVYYPGAHDNASGTAAILMLAEYYARHRPAYDMLFIAFSGEDANLRGSTFYAEHPLVPLDRVKYLINLDMICDNNPVQYCEVSDAGMPAYSLFEQLNAKGHYFMSLDRGELAANSDHYPFAVRGVPCIFFENEKGDAFPFYHTPQDDFSTARFDSWIPLFHLITDFITWMSK